MDHHVQLEQLKIRHSRPQKQSQKLDYDRHHRILDHHHFQKRQGKSFYIVAIQNFLIRNSAPSSTGRKFDNRLSDKLLLTLIRSFISYSVVVLCYFSNGHVQLQIPYARRHSKWFTCFAPSLVKNSFKD